MESFLGVAMVIGDGTMAVFRESLIEPTNVYAKVNRVKKI